jgi:hypothetical protein
LPAREVPAATPCAAAEENWSNFQCEKRGTWTRWADVQLVRETQGQPSAFA